MRIRDIGVLAVFALPLAFAFPATADDVKGEKSKDEVKVVDNSGQYVLAFPEGGTRFIVTRDLAAGSLMFRAADNVTVTKAPVVTLRSATLPKEVIVTAVPADKGMWRVSHELLKADKFDGTVAVVVGDRTYTTPLVLEPMRTVHHGGHLVKMTSCGKDVEIVQDLTTGTVTVYCADDVKITDPVVIVTEPRDAGEVKFVSVAGEPGAWRATNAVFKTTNVDGTLRVMVDGKACEVPMTWFGSHGGRIVRVENGPRFEVVRDPKTGYVFYALDEKIDGKAVVIEDPKVVWTSPEGPRTVVLTPVENQPRAWRWAGIDAGVREPGDARLSFTMFGRTLETGLGLSGAGVSAR